MKKPDNFNAGATRRNPIEDAINGNFSSQRALADEKQGEAKDSREKFIVAFPKGERSIFKAFCAAQEVSMNHFALCAMDYFKDEIESGKVVLTPHGYKRK